MRLSDALTVEDLRGMARWRVPRMFFDYVDGGSWTETTLRRNRDDFASILLAQRVGRDLSDRSLATTLVGQPSTIPVAIAPTGMAGMLWPDGEIELARAAGAAGIPYIMSTMSICPIEAVARQSDTPFWFQLYVMRDRQFVANLMARARAVGCPVLVLTLDLQVLGRRHADARNRLSAPPRLSVNSAIQLASRPVWCLSMLRATNRNFGNIVGHVPGVDGLARMAEWTAQQFEPTLDWDAVRRIRDLWPGKLMLKGILDVTDAELALGTGADAIIVSNHGGRQQDGARSSISVLPDIVSAVGERIEVHMDGGVRSGQDVLKALALGARGVHVGRAALYGLGAAGEAGVGKVLSILRDELDLSMAFAGERKITDIGLHSVDIRHG